VRKARTPNNGWFTLLFIDIDPDAVKKITYKLTVKKEMIIDFSQTFPQNWDGTEADMVGYSAKEIADQLFLSINTIKTHNKHIFSKLNVASREELILYINMLKEIGKEL